MTNIPTIERLHQLFELRPDGKLIRRITIGPRAKAGDAAGCLTPEGYLVVGIDRRLYFGHRIVFAMTNGRWPENEVDHINGKRSDNRPENLRDVSGSKNSQNRAIHRAGHLVGTSKEKNGAWRAQGTIDGKIVYLGLHATAEAANEAYRAWIQGSCTAHSTPLP